MTAFDYSRPLATAQRLIERFGRRVTLQGVSDGPSDPNNPLGSPAAAPAPVAGIPATFVQPSSLNTLGFGARITELFADATQVAIIAPVSGIDLDEVRFLIDNDGTKWKVTYIEKLKPGETTILYFIGVARP